MTENTEKTEVTAPIDIDQSYFNDLDLRPPVERIIKNSRGRNVRVLLKDLSDMTLRRLIRKNWEARKFLEVTFLPEAFPGLKEPVTIIPDEDDVWDATALQFRVAKPSFTYIQWLFLLRTDAQLVSNINIAFSEIDTTNEEAVKNDSGDAPDTTAGASLSNTIPESE